MSARPERVPATGIALGALCVGVGGLLLGVQVDANGAWSGTGLASLGAGALLALAALLARSSAGHAPRDSLGLVAHGATFLGLAFALGGVLAPGGPWMFLQIAAIVAVVLWRKPEPASGRWIGRGALILLGVLLLFRLWISYQGSRHRWEVLEIPVPVLSWIPFEFLAPLQTISLGSFTPHELGFPPAGLAFAPSSALWALGFATCVAGLLLLQSSALEHEDERIHDLLSTLPPPLCDAVERVVPAEEWRALGLHGLPARTLARRIESLVAERVRKLDALGRTLAAADLAARASANEFEGEIQRALMRGGERGDTGR